MTGTQQFECFENGKFDSYNYSLKITNKRRRITSNIYKYEDIAEESSKTDEFDKKQYNWNIQWSSQQHQQNNQPLLYNHHRQYKYHNDNHRYYYKNKHNNRHSHLIQIQSSEECQLFDDKDQTKNENCLESINIGYSGYAKHTKTVEMQQKKTPISVLNEWAMRNQGSNNKKSIVSYTLVAVTGLAHRPIFTYACQVHNKTAKGDGKSKKEAKQNAAAQLLKTIFKSSSSTDSDKIITSTTITDNIVTNENGTDSLTDIEGSQILDDIDSDVDIDYKDLIHLHNEEVQIAHCNMNPIGALQELSTVNKWAAPFYSFEKISSSNKGYHQHNNLRRKTVLYKVICQIFHLQSTGTAKTKRLAKRMAARLMFDLIMDIGAEKLNELKSKTGVLITNKDNKDKEVCMIQEENQKLQHNWNTAFYFRLYFNAAAMASKNELSPSYHYLTNEGQDKYQIKLEESIVKYDQDINAIDQLQTLCEELGFQAVYVCVNDFVLCDQIHKNDTPIHDECTVLVQVSTVPVIVTVGRAATADVAMELAAKQVLHTFKSMLLITSNT